MTTDKRVEEILRQTHTFLPVDLKDREEFLQYLETALTQYHQDLMSEVVEKLDTLHRNSEARELECSQEGYEYGIEEAQNIIKSLSK